MSIVLAVDTISVRAHVAIYDGERELSAASAQTTRATTEVLIELVESALGVAHLSKEELEAIAVCVGPGSFTGIRSGIALAQGLSIGLGIPIFGVSALLAPLVSQFADAQIRVNSMQASSDSHFVAAYRICGEQDRGAPLEVLEGINSVESSLLESHQEDLRRRLSDGGDDSLFSVEDYDFASGDSPALAGYLAQIVQLEEQFRPHSEQLNEQYQYAPPGGTVEPLYVKNFKAITLAERGMEPREL